MNGKRARAIRRVYGVKHVHQVPASWRTDLRFVPRWVGGWIETVRTRVQSVV